MADELGSKTITLTLKEVIGVLLFLISFVFAVGVGFGSYSSMKEDLDKLIEKAEKMEARINEISKIQSEINGKIKKLKD
ncbi:MAG: hypothetical protein AAGH46_07275 [Bacteroidota bacterium]